MIKLGCDKTIPNGWRWVAAQDVIDVRDGTHDSPKYVAQGVPLVTSKNLVNGEIDFSSCQLISAVNHEQISKRSRVDDGDILYAMIGTIGNPVIVSKTFDFSIKNVALFKFSGTEVHNRFFYHFLNSALAEQQFSNNARGGTQKFVSLGNIRGLQIPLPPLAEQQRIAAILDKADALRRKRQQAIDLAGQFLRSVFLDMFGDPVSNPKGWEVVPMSEFSSFENGDRSSNYPSGDDIVDAGVLFLSTKNIVQDELSLKNCQYITKEKFHSLSRGKARQCDLIITLRGTLGACCIFESKYETAFINAQMMIIRPDSNVSNIYLHDLIASRAIKAQLQRIGQGAAVPQLTAKQLKDLELPLPPVELQRHYERVRQPVLAMVGKMKGFSDEGLFESLSQQAFRGEL